MKNFSAIILLFIANSISGIAQGISMIAIPWYFVQQNEMETFGWIYVFLNLIALFWVPYAGTLVDRYNRKNILLIITLVCGLVLGAVTAFGFFNSGLPLILVAAVFMMTFFNYNIHYPNLYALVQEISEKKWYGRIASYIEIQGQFTSVLAGAGAAILLEGTHDGKINLFGVRINIGQDILPWQIHEIFLLDTLTYVAAFLIIFLMSYQPLVERVKENTRLLKQLRTGYFYLKKNSKIFLFGVASYSIFVAVLITTFYLAAAYVEGHLQTTGDVFAAGEMYYSVGAVFAGFAIQWIFRKTSIPFSVIILTFLSAALFAVLALTKNEFIFYAMFAILGLTNAGTRIRRVTFLFSHVHNQVYGRANSIFVLTNILFRILFLSLFALPFFHADGNVVFAFGILSLFLLISGIILIRYLKDFVRLKPI